MSHHQEDWVLCKVMCKKKPGCANFKARSPATDGHGTTTASSPPLQTLMGITLAQVQAAMAMPRTSLKTTTANCHEQEEIRLTLQNSCSNSICCRWCSATKLPSCGHRQCQGPAWWNGKLHWSYYKLWQGFAHGIVERSGRWGGAKPATWNGCIGEHDLDDESLLGKITEMSEPGILALCLIIYRT